MIVPRLRFRSLRTRLAVLYAGLFAAAMMIVGFAGQLMVLRHAEQSTRAELVTSGSVFDRLWMLRTRSLGDTAGVLAHDFGFRAAVASGDQPTILSALANLRERAGVPYAFLVGQDGGVTGDGDPRLRASVAALPFRLAPGRQDAVAAVGGGVFRMVVSPILAPTEIGWVVFAVRLDRGEMQALERLSAIPLTATILRREPHGHWLPATAGFAPDGHILDAFMAAAGARDQPATLALAHGRAIVLARPLAAASGPPEAVLLLSYPLHAALAPYRSLQFGIVAAGLVGLILVLLGSRLLAAGIARPIAALDAAARALEDGDRAEVAVSGSDEIGRLATSFNRMSAGIVERENRIAHLAFHDVLTGLPNRALFRQQIDASLARVARNRTAAAVLCLDLDGFKIVNDSFGHPTGDALLRCIGGLLRELAGDGFVARLSGDEFAIVIDYAEGHEPPRALAQAIVDRLHAPVTLPDRALLAGASIGIAVAPGDGADGVTLLKHADLALYRAKQDGRGNFRFFEPALDAAARARRQLELDLREALAGGQLRLDYQPIFCLRTDRISGFEALMRWDHPTRGLISPAEFIPIAEASGLIVAMGEWVVQQACREAMRWPGDVRVAVNVSPLQFRNAGFAAIVIQALARSGLAPQRLEIEITESVFLEGAAPTIELLHRLRALGVRIALDDFGTGYSSLSYLRSFPFDKIKIDRSFVSPIAEEESAAAIVRAIVDLAGALGMDTTAEGVEEEAQLAALRARGCGSIQGFLLSRPVGADAAAAMLGTREVADHAVRQARRVAV